MVCRICNQEIPDDSGFCQYCGTRIADDLGSRGAASQSEFNAYTADKGAEGDSRKEPSSGSASDDRDRNRNHRRRPVWPIVLAICVILGLGVGFLSYCYNSFFDALYDEQFLKAEQYYQMIPFRDKLLSGPGEYLRAGILAEEGKYTLAYRALNRIVDYPVPDYFLNEMKERIYLKARSLYEDGDYDEAGYYFAEIPDYKRSKDYSALITCRTISPLRPDFASTAAYKNTIALLNEHFSDAEEVILYDDTLLFHFLTGRWENGDDSNPRYFELYEDEEGEHSRYRLPAKDVDAYFWITDGMYKLGDTAETATKIFRFSLLDEDTIQVYCFKDGSMIKLFRQ